jgi:hypothetical protein
MTQETELEDLLKAPRTVTADYLYKLEKCRQIIEYIASDGVQTSWSMIVAQRDNYKKLCIEMKDELNE